MKTVLGIDYASVDGNKAPDLGKAKKAGLRYAIVRATYGLTMDSALQRDWKALAKAGVVRGAYMFPVMAHNRAPEPQIARFVEAVNKAGGLIPVVDLPPVLDVEFPKGIEATGMTRLKCLDWVLRAVTLLEDAFDCHPIIYTSARVWDGEDEDSLDADRVPVPDLVECPLWLARYPYRLKIASHHRPEERDGLRIPPVPAQLGDANDVWFHQYQGDAIGFPGFTSTVDLNRFFPLSLGAKGDRVRTIQRKLQIKVDGVWGPKTDAAVRAFQRARGLVEDDGMVGPRTFAALAWIRSLP